MRILIFGTGKYYLNRKKYIRDKVVAFIDNKVKDSVRFEDKIALHPSQWKNIDFDIVLLMSTYQKEMKSQLLELGIAENLIWTWDRYFFTLNAGRIDLCIRDIEQGGKKVLVLTESLSYNGGSLTAVYAAVELKQKGYEVWLAGGIGNINETFLSEVRELKINLAIIYDCPKLLKEDLYWIKEFDIVIVNVFQMLKCACDISYVRPVLWWLHEPDCAYKPILDRFPDYYDDMKLKKINIIAVSDVAKDCFKHYFPSVTCGIMPYGIPDERVFSEGKKSKKYIYAIIGAVAYIKGQDIFLKAVELMGKDGFENVEFWIIGAIGDDGYSENVCSMAKRMPNVKIWGNLSRKEISEAFNEIDTVVSTSREDSLPIVLAEGMMYGKICISSDSTGMAKYIMDGENGFVFESESIEAVYEKMKWIFLHRDELNDIKKNARDTYEKKFSMEVFGERLENELVQTEKLFDIA